MKILVLIKAVTDVETPLFFDVRRRCIGHGVETLLKMNYYDAFALEEALLIGEKIPNTVVHALTVGPPEADAVLVRALETGAQKAFHLVTPSEVSLTPLQTAMAAAPHAVGYDLVLTGVMSEDGMHGQTGPFLSEVLRIPCVTAVIATTVETAAGTMIVERETEGGNREGYEVLLPALLTIQSGINRPRYPTLSRVLWARKQIIETLPAPINIEAPRERIERYYRPERGGACRFLEGNTEEQAQKFMEICRDLGLVA